MMPFAYVRAGSLDEAIALLQEHGSEAHLMAGGTSFVLLANQGLIEPGVVVGLDGARELTGIRELEDGTIEIGAMTTLGTIERDATVLGRLPELARTVSRVATVRVRNQATLGGNIAHADPAQDPPPMLLALDAVAVIRGPEGERLVPLHELFVDVFETVIEEGEILSAIRIPPVPAAARMRYLKFLPRTVDDYATVSVAARLDLAADGTVGDCRIALGAAGPIPFRVPEAEAALRGHRPDTQAFAAAADLAAAAADPVDDLRGTAAYKRDMTRIWTRRVLEQLGSPRGDA